MFRWFRNVKKAQRLWKWCKLLGKIVFVVLQLKAPESSHEKILKRCSPLAFIQLGFEVFHFRLKVYSRKHFVMVKHESYRPMCKTFSFFHSCWPKCSKSKIEVLLQRINASFFFFLVVFCYFNFWLRVLGKKMCTFSIFFNGLQWK